MKPLIAITSSLDSQDILKEAWDRGPGSHLLMHVNETYVRCVVDAGGMPLLLPTLEDTEGLERLLDLADGLLVTGGSDVDPASYGEVDSGLCGPVSPVQDRSDMFIIRHFVERGRPVLAICRGMQVMDVAFGGTLYQDVVSACGVADHSGKGMDASGVNHDVVLEEGSLLASVFGSSSLAVKSFQLQAVKTTGAGFSITARSADGLVEAIEGPGQFTLGVQWHPEKMHPNPVQDKLFAAFVEACR